MNLTPAKLIVFTTLFFVASILQTSFGQITSSTEVDQIESVSLSYLESNFEGKLKNGKKHGEWIEYNTDGVIYSYSYFDNGVPIDTWTIYTPWGSKWQEIEYKAGKKTKISLFRSQNKLIEIISDDSISSENYKSIQKYEKAFFTKMPDIFPSKTASKSITLNHYDFYDLYKVIIAKLKYQSIKGSIIYYNQNNSIRRVTRIQGDDIFRTSYIYKNDMTTLWKIKEFKNDTLIKTTKFDNRGNVILLKPSTIFIERD